MPRSRATVNTSASQVVMTIEKGGRPTSPVHVHVDNSTPVHVHVKKAKKQDQPQEKMAEVKSRSITSSSNLRRSTATARSRSRSPERSGPWVPPPGKTSKGVKYQWQGPSHRLEITNPADADAIQTTLRMSDLSTDDEDRLGTNMRQYEKKIDHLMGEVGTLKNEVTLQRTLREMKEKDNLLETSRNVLEDQQAELDEYRRELEATEVENRILRKSMDRLKDDVDSSPDCRDRGLREHEILMKKLVEVEMDGQAAAKQVAALRDMIRRMKEEKRLSSSDSAMLAKQKELLMERMSDFETTNRTLRKMLRDRHEEEAENLRLSEQRDLLLKKLSETEDNMQHLRAQVFERDRKLADLRMGLEAQKEENMAISGLQTSLESTRAHLQKQLRQKEGDCNRMAVQIRTLDSQLAQEKIDNDHLQGLVMAAKTKADRDKEALKKATRVQKQRASRSEDAVEQLNAQLMERDAHIAELRTDIDNLRSHIDKIGKEKTQAMSENASIKTRIAELENIMGHIEDSSKVQVESATAQLHEKAGEATTLKLENERLKTSLATIEDKLTQAEGEMTQLRGNLRQYEALVDEYRTQMNRSRREADETMVQLEDSKRESTRQQRDSDVELDKVKARLQSRLAELEPIPEMLKTTELRLQDANEKILQYEKRNSENTRLIAELTAKVEHQSSALDHTRDKLHSTQETFSSSQSKMDVMERKLRDLEDQNRDLLQTIAKREEAVHQTNMRLDEKSRESVTLQRQLEATITDARRTTDTARDKISAKERSSQSRVLELEAQLSQARSENARIKREKEETERKFNSRLYDLKDRLEQSHSTNRSMQNYVQFLKTSYANVFGDTSVVATSSPIRSTYPY